MNTNVFKRYEKKYLITRQQYAQLAKIFEPRMVPDRFARSTIGNIYYDTPDFRLIRRSLDRPAYKEKLRLRTYLTPQQDSESFIEIKKKFDHIVYKRRIALPYGVALNYLDGGIALNSDVLSDADNSQIAREIDWFCSFYEGLRPAMCISYDRYAVFDKEQPALRVTFDSHIRWRADRLDLSYGMDGQSVLDGDTCLMEIKIPGAAPLWLARALSDAGVFPTHFSKYGRAYQLMLTQSQTVSAHKGGVFCA